MNDPLLIVAALNGTRQRDACPKVPLSPEELAAAEAHAAHELHDHGSVLEDFKNLEITSESVLHSSAVGGHESNPHQH